jgi:hydroxyacylglutathione hydrolase
MPYEAIDFLSDAPVEGSLDVMWIHGSPSKGQPDPPIQVHRYDEHTLILRQSKDVSFEAPFMYLFFGNDRALLLDTGATADAKRFPLRETIDGLIRDWLVKHPRERYGLVVAHTHSHRDHIAGDGQFVSRPQTEVLKTGLDAVSSFFGIPDWPEGKGVADLGGRILEVFGAPGHHITGICIYDPWSGLLVTGDNVYPGRLYVSDFPAFVASLNRLVAYCERGAVSHVMGCHIEMTRVPRRDYPFSTKYQPDEPPLQMTVNQLVAVRDAAVSVADRPGAHVFDDFIIFNGPCHGAVVKQLVRGALGNLRRRSA